LQQIPTRVDFDACMAFGRGEFGKIIAYLRMKGNE